MESCEHTEVRKTSDLSSKIIAAIPFLLISFLVVINVLPFLAPLLAHAGHDRSANIIYGIYSFFCHQKAHRSLYIYDHQCAWCMRDTFIWSSILVVGLIVFSTRKRYPGLSLKIAFLLGLPMALDGGIQLIATVTSLYSRSAPFYESTNSIRALTGSWFGIAIASYLFPRLKNELAEGSTETLADTCKVCSTK